MSSDSDFGPVFLDLTSLVEYCSAYFDEQHYAKKVIDQCRHKNSDLIISNGAKVTLNERMNNRKRLWCHLIDESSEIINNSDKSKQDYKADVLNYTSLQSAMEFDIKEGYISDIEALRNNLNEETLENFRKKVDDARIMGRTQRIEIERMIEFETCGAANQSPWMVESVISQYTDSEDHTSSVLDYAYWSQTNSGPLVVGSNSNISNDKNAVTDAIESNLSQASPEIYSCKEIVDAYLN